jgi:DNA-binding transcriptional MerR regulator
MKRSSTYHLSIGAVSKRTGISTPNIRMWESRHSAVEPLRSDTGRRLYREQDVRRLVLLKQLVDLGHPIRTIAPVDSKQLEKLLADHSESVSVKRSRDRRGRVLVVGPGIAAKLRGHHLLEADLVDEMQTVDEAMAAKQLPEVDLLVIEVDGLFPNVIASIRELVRRTGAKRSLLTYYFSNSQTAKALVGTVNGLVTLRAPVDGAQLLRECVVLLESLKPEGNPHGDHSHEEIPDRVFTSEQLAHLTTISSTVECECPQHLAELLQALGAFENYSRQCEDRNPQDALLHSFLYRTTAQARRSMENALKEVLYAESIDMNA